MNKCGILFGFGMIRQWDTYVLMNKVPTENEVFDKRIVAGKEIP